MSEQNQLPFLPSGWAKAKIENLILPGGVFVDGDWVESKDQDPNGDVRLIQLADIGDGKFLNRSARFLTYEKAQELRCTFLGVGDVLIARMPEPLGRACLFPGDVKKAVTVVDVCIVRTRLGDTNHRWLVWAINSPEFRREIAALQSGVTRRRISRGNLATLFLPIPPLAEQQRIVNEIEKQFSRLDAAAEMLQRVERNLDRLRAATLKAAVEGRLVPTEAELARAEGRDYEPADVLLQRILRERRARWEADQLAKMKEQGKTPKDDKWKDKYPEPAVPSARDLQLPQGWTWATIDQLSELVTKGSSPNWQGFEYTSEGIIFVRSQNVLWGTLDLSDKVFLPPAFNKKEKKSILKTNDVLLNIVGASIGRSALATKEAEGGNVNQAVAVIRLIEDGLLPALLVNTFISPNYQAIIHAKEVDVARANLSLEDIKTTTLMLSPLREQYRTIAEIERRISVIEELKTLVTNALRRGTILRQKILRDAFAGKLIPQDPADEPAGILLERIRAEKVEREVEASQARKERRGKMKGRKAKPSTRKQRRPLREVVVESKRRLTPEQLFAEAGFTPEVVEVFYEELRSEIEDRHIEQVRPDSAKVYLIAANA